MLEDSDLNAIWLTIKLASIVTMILLVLGTPLAWWLARTSSKLGGVVSAIVALPLVLPPTVLGFYMLVLFSPQSSLGQLTQSLGLGTLAFTFWGLVLASVVYSLPFVVQPLQNAMSAIPTASLEAAATLGASPLDRFFSVVIPLSKTGYITSAVLGFAHTIGEFGVVLMIGGNIPGETQLISVKIYEHVEALNYPQAHILSLGMLAFSFVVLLLVYSKSSLFGTRPRSGQAF